MTFHKTLPLLAALMLATVAHADINVGVTVSATGPAASLGIPEKKHDRPDAHHDCRTEDQLHRA